MNAQIHIGCCGFPKAMPQYFRTFSVVEIQKTFYQLPREDTAAGWREKAPANFEFTLKAWQGITHLSTSPTYRRPGITIPDSQKPHYGHFQPTDEVMRAWEATRRIAEILQARIIVLQCPPNFKPGDENQRNLETFLQAIQPHPFRLALEFRADWPREFIEELCRRFPVIHCTDPFAADPVPGDITYYRLHGAPPGEKMYRYQYADDDLHILADKLTRDTQAGREVYCLFNNITMWEDALRFREQIAELA